MRLSNKTVQWDIVAKKAAEPWGKALIDQYKGNLDKYLSLYSDHPPIMESGWGHYYFCDTCGNSLIFDLTKPKEHVCSKCKKVFSGSPYDNSWVNSFHGLTTGNLIFAAILAHLPDSEPQYIDFLRRTILFYANHYHEYENHSTHCGQGKIQPDNLTEAWFISNIIKALRFSIDLNLFTEEEYDLIAEKLVRPELLLLKQQIKRVHNIHITMMGAVMACADYLCDNQLLDEAINGHLGFYYQLNEGVRKDGFWFEISDSYHSLTLSSLLYMGFIGLENGIDLFSNPIMAKMGKVYARLAYEDGLLPAYSDGWYGHHLYDYEYQFEQLSRAYDTDENPYYSKLLSFCYKLKEKEGVKTTTGFSRCSLEALLYGPLTLPECNESPINKESDLFEDTGIAILRNSKTDLRVNLKGSKHGGGHDHNDKLSIEVYKKGEYLAVDPGTSGYSLPLTGHWSRTSLAHCMVCVDQLRQKDSNAAIISFDGMSAEAVADDSYDHAKMSRKVLLTDTGFLDEFMVYCDSESMMDWVWSCIGEVESSLSLSPFDMELIAKDVIIKKSIPETSYDPRYIENGYDQLMDLTSTVTNEDFSVVFTTKKQRMKLTFKGADDTRVILGHCYGTSYIDIKNILIVRRYGKETKYCVKFEINDVTQ